MRGRDNIARRSLRPRGDKDLQQGKSTNLKGHGGIGSRYRFERCDLGNGVGGREIVVSRGGKGNCIGSRGGTGNVTLLTRDIEHGVDKGSGLVSRSEIGKNRWVRDGRYSGEANSPNKEAAASKYL